MKISLIVLTAILALVAVLIVHLKWFESDTRKKYGYWIVVALIIISTAVQIKIQINESYEQRTEASAGRLDLDTRIGTDWVVAMGDSESLISGVDFRKWLGEDCNIRVANGTPSVSCVIRDVDGLLIARITDNEWQTNPNNAFDRNYNKNAFEVISQSGEVVLQIRVVDSRIQLQVKLNRMTGDALYFGSPNDMPFVNNDGSRHLGGVILRDEKTSPKRVRFPNIKPIFKYPSELHLGEFAEE